MIRTDTRVGEPLGDRMFLGVLYLILTLVLLAVLYPLIYIISSSFSSTVAVSSGQVVLWPVDFSTRGYEVAFNNPDIVTGYANSLFYTVVGTLISLVLTISLAYPLSRKSLYGRSGLMLFLLFTMLFSGGLIPTYLVVKELGMLDTRWAMVIPQAIAVWQVIIARTFFQTSIPEEVMESAVLDGASDLRLLWSIVLPLSKPLIAVLVLMYAIFNWNSYFDALLYLRSPDLHPLQLVLRGIVILNTTTSSSMDTKTLLERQNMADLLKYSLIVIACVPVMILYPFIQRYFAKGVLIGAVKG